MSKAGHDAAKTPCAGVASASRGHVVGARKGKPRRPDHLPVEDRPTRAHDRDRLRRALPQSRGRITARRQQARAVGGVELDNLHAGRLHHVTPSCRWNAGPDGWSG